MSEIDRELRATADRLRGAAERLRGPARGLRGPADGLGRAAGGARASAAPDEPPAIAEAAAAAGLLDVAYATHDSPVGRLVLAVTPAGLARIAYVEDRAGEDAVLTALAARVSPRVLAAPRRLDPVRRELDEYFAGRLRAFGLALDLRLATAFARRVLTATAAIPYGSVASYLEVATRAGSPRGSRAAGNALGSNPLPIVLPCHRVVHSGGGLGGYTGGLERKLKLLAIERGEPAG